MRGQFTGPAESVWSGNEWYDLEGRYYASAEDAAFWRSVQRARAERDRVRLAKVAA